MVYFRCTKLDVLNRPILVSNHAFKHGLEIEDIEHAWTHRLFERHRGAPHEGEVILIGPALDGSLMEVVAAERPQAIVIYHAMTPPSKHTFDELNIGRRARWSLR